MTSQSNKIVFDYQNYSSLSEFIKKTREKVFFENLGCQNIIIEEQLAKAMGLTDRRGKVAVEPLGESLSDYDQRQGVVLKLNEGRTLYKPRFSQDYEYDIPVILVKVKPFDINEIAPKSSELVANIPKVMDIVNNEHDFNITHKAYPNYANYSLLHAHPGEVELLAKSVGDTVMIRFTSEAPSVGQKTFIFDTPISTLDISADQLEQLPLLPGLAISEANAIHFYLSDLLKIENWTDRETLIKYEENPDDYQLLTYSAPTRTIEHSEVMVFDNNLKAWPKSQHHHGMLISKEYNIPEECLKKIHPTAELVDAISLISFPDRLSISMS